MYNTILLLAENEGHCSECIQMFVLLANEGQKAT